MSSDLLESRRTNVAPRDLQQRCPNPDQKHPPTTAGCADKIEQCVFQHNGIGSCRSSCDSRVPRSLSQWSARAASYRRCTLRDPTPKDLSKKALLGPVTISGSLDCVCEIRAARADDSFASHKLAVSSDSLQRCQRCGPPTCLYRTEWVQNPSPDESHKRHTAAAPWPRVGLHVSPAFTGWWQGQRFMLERHCGSRGGARPSGHELCTNGPRFDHSLSAHVGAPAIETHSMDGNTAKRKTRILAPESTWGSPQPLPAVENGPRVAQDDPGVRRRMALFCFSIVKMVLAIKRRSADWCDEAAP